MPPYSEAMELFPRKDGSQTIGVLTTREAVGKRRKANPTFLNARPMPTAARLHEFPDYGIFAESCRFLNGWFSATGFPEDTSTRQELDASTTMAH